MRIYIASSFGDGQKAMDKLFTVVKSAGLQGFDFVREYPQAFASPQDLMLKAKEEIQKSDAFLIDMTDKPTGRAIEAGIAYALGKKIIVIMKTGTALKDTTRGIADVVIQYESIDDISKEMREALQKWS